MQYLLLTLTVMVTTCCLANMISRLHANTLRLSPLLLLDKIAAVLSWIRRLIILINVGVPLTNCLQEKRLRCLIANKTFLIHHSHCVLKRLLLLVFHFYLTWFSLIYFVRCCGSLINSRAMRTVGRIWLFRTYGSGGWGLEQTSFLFPGHSLAINFKTVHAENAHNWQNLTD